MTSKFNKEPCMPAQMAEYMRLHWGDKDARAKRLLLHWWAYGIIQCSLLDGYKLALRDVQVHMTVGAAEPTEVGKIIQKAYRDKCRKASR